MWKSKQMKKLFLMSILGFCLTLTSCKTTEIVYVSFTKPVEAKGVLMIIDKRPIKVFNPETETYSFLDLRGFYPIHKQDYKAFVQALKEKHDVD